MCKIQKTSIIKIPSLIFVPSGAAVFEPRSWGHQETAITLEVMRVVLAIGLFAIGVELPQKFMKDHARGLLVMVVPMMALMKARRLHKK